MVDPPGAGIRPAPPVSAPRLQVRWLVLLAVAAGLLLGACSGDDDDSSTDDGTATTTTSTTEPPEPLDAEGEALLAGLAAWQTLTVHATYSTGGPDGDGQFELWQDGERVRFDVSSVAEGSEIRSAGFLLDDEAVVCSKIGDQPWTCSEQEASSVDLTQVFGDVRAQLGGLDVTTVADTVLDREVTCYQFSSDGADGEMCLLESGLPARILNAASELVLIGLETDFDAAVFEPPAEPVNAST